MCPDPQADTECLSLWLWVCFLFFACEGRGEGGRFWCVVGVWGLLCGWWV